MWIDFSLSLYTYIYTCIHLYIHVYICIDDIILCHVIVDDTVYEYRMSGGTPTPRSASGRSSRLHATTDATLYRAFAHATAKLLQSGYRVRHYARMLLQSYYRASSRYRDLRSRVAEHVAYDIQTDTLFECTVYIT